MSSESNLSYLQKLLENEKNTTSLENSLLMSASYDGDLKVAVLKFYNPDTKKIHLWYDDTGHKPYCLIKQDSISKEDTETIRKRSDVVNIKEVGKRDLLNDRTVKMYKVTVADPLVILSIREFTKSWESDIKYYENFLYDKGFQSCAFYKIVDSKIVPSEYETSKAVRESLDKTLKKADDEIKKIIEEWAELLSQPLPDIRRVALDIEVIPAEVNRIPDPNEAAQEVVAV